MNNNNISVSEALKRLKNGESLAGVAVDFNEEPIKALDAFLLGNAGIDVPEQLIHYDDKDVAYDPDFDNYEWARTDAAPAREHQGKAVLKHPFPK